MLSSNPDLTRQLITDRTARLTLGARPRQEPAPPRRSQSPPRHRLPLPWLRAGRSPV